MSVKINELDIVNETGQKIGESRNKDPSKCYFCPNSIILENHAKLISPKYKTMDNILNNKSMQFVNEVFICSTCYSKIMLKDFH